MVISSFSLTQATELQIGRCLTLWPKDGQILKSGSGDMAQCDLRIRTEYLLAG